MAPTRRDLIVAGTAATGLAALAGGGTDAVAAAQTATDGDQQRCGIPLSYNNELYQALTLNQLRREFGTQLDGLQVEDPVSFFDHTFARPGSPDDKNWLYTDADISKHGSEVQLDASSTELQSTQRGYYPPGSQSTPGVAARVTGTPTAGDGRAGYFSADNGFGVGEDTTDSFVFLRKGGTDHVVHRGDWNLFNPSERVWQTDSPIITRFPHLFYGGGSIEVRAVLYQDGKSGELTPLHRFTPENIPSSFLPGPPFGQPNLPITFASNGLSGGNVRANAAHYQFAESKSETRVNGEHYTNVDAGTTGWTHLLTMRKRSGWEMVNVKPLEIFAAAASADAKLELQLDPTLSGTNFSLPTHSSSDDTAIEVSTAGSIDTNGERRWVGYAVSGQGNKTGSPTAKSLTFNIPANQPVTLAAQGVSSTATLSGNFEWEEFF